MGLLFGISQQSTVFTPTLPMVLTFENYSVGTTSDPNYLYGAWTCAAGASVQNSTGAGAGTYPKCLRQTGPAFGSNPIFNNDYIGFNLIPSNSGFGMRITGAASDNMFVTIRIFGSIQGHPTITGGNTLQTDNAEFIVTYPYNNYAQFYAGDVGGGFGSDGWGELYKMEIYLL